VLNKKVPVNTVSRTKDVPKTTLRKVLEKLCIKGKVVTKTAEKKRRYQLDGVNLTAESLSRAADTDIDFEMINPELVDTDIDSEVVDPELVDTDTDSEVVDPELVDTDIDSKVVDPELVDTVRPTIAKSKF